MSGDFRLRSVAWPVFLPGALYGLAHGAILPVIALSAIDRGASTATAALITALIGIGALIANIPSGALATRVGERKAMLIASGMTICGLSLCLVQPDDGSGALLLYGAGILLIGSASAVFNLARQAYLADAVPVAWRARAFSTLGGSARMGLFIGPFLTAVATHLWGLQAAYGVGLAAIGVTAAIVWRIPDLEVSERHRKASADVTTWMIIRDYRRVFLTVGIGVVLLSALRQTRHVVIPLWANHLGLSPTTSSTIYGIAGGVDAMLFYPAGRVMDRRGRRWVSVPCVLILAAACVLMTLTNGATSLTLVAILMGFGNGIGAGIVMTLGADNSPAIGRNTFLGVWRVLADSGSGAGPLLFAGMTALAGLAAGLLASGALGVLAAVALWRWIPRDGARLSAGPEP